MALGYVATFGKPSAKFQQVSFSIAPCLRISKKLNSSWNFAKQQTHGEQSHHGVQGVSHDQIQALCQQGHLQRALHLLFSLPPSAHPPSDHVYVFLLKSCKKGKALVHAQHIYAHLMSHPIKKLSSFLGNYLVLTLVACGGVEIAYVTSQRLTCVTASSWAAMISGFTECGQGRKALEMYKNMLQAQVEPNAYTLANLLKVCGSLQDLEVAKKLHADAVEMAYNVDVFVGSTLVSVYGKCRSLLEAENVFSALPQRNVVSWNAMLASYIENNKEEKALRLYRQMRAEGVSSNHLTFVAALQACGTLGEKKCCDLYYQGPESKSDVLEIGRALHADARKESFASNAYVESTLLNMYRNCSFFMEVEAVFISLSEHNAVSWNVMLAAYTEQGQERKALQLYREMQEESVNADHQTLMLALIACCGFAEKEEAVSAESQLFKVVSYRICRALHLDAWSMGFASDVIMGSILIRIYGKCVTIAEAENVFSGLSRPDVFAWNAMLAAYVEQVQEEKAFKLYRQMQEEGVCQDELTLVAALQTCGSFAGKEEAAFKGRCTLTISLEIGKALHSVARRHGFESITHVGNTLISMYGKCGSIGHAEIVFGSLLMPDIVSWNAMLSMYVEESRYDSALQLYRQLRREGYVPDKLTLAFALKACGIAADKEAMAAGRESMKGMPLKVGMALHFEALIRGLDSDKRVRSRLVSLYDKCGNIMEAESVFVEAPLLDAVCWNVMLLAYVEQDQGEKALQLYKLMQEQNFVDERAVVSSLRACGSILKKEVIFDGLMISAKCLEIGQGLHAYARKNGFDLNVFVGSALISMYSKCGCIAKAEHVFDRIPNRNIVLWNTMLSAYVEHGEGKGTLQLFRMMQKEGAQPDRQTLTIAIQACCMLAEKEEAVVIEGQPLKALSFRIGQALHVEAAHDNDFSMDVFVANTLVSMYGKCGAIREAERTFYCSPEQSTVSWNVILSAYVEYDHWEKAIQLYRHLERVHMAMDDATFVYILQASSQTGSVEVCRQVHCIITSSGIQVSSLLATTLVHTYGNCGCMRDAESAFNKLTQPDVVAWSTCVAGFGHQGNSRASLHILNEMHMEGIEADEVACSSFLSACSHAGLVDEGVHYFNYMSRNSGISPHLKHYANIIDLLARAGNLVQVEYMLEKMPIKADVAIWVCVLSACCLHGNLKLARRAFNSAMRLQSMDSAGYMLMSKFYWQLDSMKIE